MRNLTLTLLIVAMLGFAHAEYMVTQDSSKNPTPCQESPAPSKLTCGGCSMGGIKSSVDLVAAMYKIEVYCTACSNGKTPDSSPATVTMAMPSGAAANANTQPTFDINMGSKCNSFLSNLPIVAVLMAFLIQAY